MIQIGVGRMPSLHPVMSPSQTMIVAHHPPAREPCQNEEAIVARADFMPERRGNLLCPILATLVENV